MVKIYYPILLFMLLSGSMIAQNAERDTSVCDGKVTENEKDRLNNQPYVYTEPHFFRVYNAEEQYASLQLGRRRTTGLFLYIKIFVFNTCIDEHYRMELTFLNNQKYSMENDHDLNCEGILIRKITNSDLKAFISNPLVSFTVQTYEKNYEFHVNDTIALKLRQDIRCLTQYKF